ncbi:helix-turn-helix domain-containing protein [Acidaminobacter sp. JC074]|uniref:AraC family transcriptional regulator n=1 Tax=Acidaminobacter sp. JC074 TaxID=2530199 RepID=UPI001F10540B|nr:helix-turn-helix domain-containing protein [Acidaminobacter sp. JC074]MCH4889390.1 helix-turn-helix domain-containing protein [Acidaminobacter sp. JC074]
MFDLNNLSPYVRVALDNTIMEAWTLTERIIFDYEIQYIKSGTIEVVIDNKVYHGKAGDIFLYKPGQTHTMKKIGNQPLRQPHLHFDLTYQNNSPDVKVCFRPFNDLSEEEKNFIREDLTQDNQMNLPNLIRLKDTTTFERLLFNIIDEFHDKPPYYESNIKGMFIQLWTYLLRENYFKDHINASNTALAKEIKYYLDNNFHQTITLDDLQDKFFTNKFHLIKIFKRIYQTTPIHYHSQVRLSKAKEYIMFTNYSLTEIGDKLGFNSLHAFSRTFKGIEGVSPSYYRQKNRS